MEITAEEIVECFNDSLIAHFFPDIQTETGQEYLLALANYTLSCGTSARIATLCPDMMCCFAQHYIGWLLASWANAEVKDDGTLCLDDPAMCEPAQFLKRKTIGGKECEYDIIDVRKTCCPCPEKAVTAWEKEWNRILECCETANAAIFITAGSWRSDCNKPKSCCGADWEVNDSCCEKKCK